MHDETDPANRVSAPLFRRAGSAELAAQIVRTRIAEGLLVPGERLSEESLSDDIGISRNTLREAFRLLNHERLLEHRFNRGVFVRALSAADVIDVFTARRTVQLAAIEQCVSGDSGLVAARVACADGRAAAAAESWRNVATANIHFHRALVSTAHSVRLSAMMDALFAELRLAFHAVDDLGRFHEPFIDRNLEMLDLLDRGQNRIAARKFLSYIDDAQSNVLDSMQH